MAKKYLFAIVLLAWTLGCKDPSDEQIQLSHVTITEGTNLAIAVDPQEQFIIHDFQGALYRMSIDDGSSTPITGYYMDARQPDLSADGEQVCFQAYQDGNWHIWTIHNDGSKLQQVTSGEFDYREPAFAPDRQSIAFSSDQSGSYDIWIKNRTSGAVIQLTNVDSNDYAPSFSHDGRTLAFIRETPEDWQVNSIDIQSKKITTHYVSQYKLYAPSLSLGDNDLTFVEHNWLTSTIKQVSLKSDSIINLTKAEEDVFPFRVQHKKSGYYYTADGQIKYQPVNATTQTIPFSLQLPVSTAKYNRKQPLFVVDKPTKIKGIYAPKISPDGDKICFIALGDVWIKDLEHDSLERVTHDPFIQLMPSWHHDGQQLVYASDRQNVTALWKYNLTTKEHTMIGEISTMPSGIDLHPDGNTIAYTMAFGPRAGRLAVMDITTGVSSSPRSIFPFATSSPSWHPDGKRIIMTILQPYSGLYREGVARTIVVNMVTGETTSQKEFTHRSYGARTNDSPLIVDNGARMIYTSEGFLHEVAIDQDLNNLAAPTTLTDILSDTPSIDHEGTQLLFSSVDELKIYDRHTKRTRSIDIDITYSNPIDTTTKVIRAGTIITMTGDRLQDHDILIQNQSIVKIQPRQNYPTAVEVIDASDQYVMPGLIDMHAHQTSELGTSLGYKWLSWGVTTTRDPATYPNDAQSRKEAQITGDLVHPRIIYTGSPIDGNRVYYNGTYAEMSLDQIKRELLRSQTLDYDFIKTYVRLADSLQRVVIQYAHDNGLPVTSHELYPAALTGIDGVEHILGTSRRGYTPKMSQTYKSYSDVPAIISAAEMTFTPTIGIYSGYNYMLYKHPELLEDQRLLTLENSYNLSNATAAINVVKESPANHREMFERQASLIKKVYEAEGMLIAGTDSPIIPYGFGLFTELLCYQAAGLTPYAVLETTTTNAAKALNAADQIGSIQEGLLADLIILDADPTEDIYNLKEIDKVVLSGRVLSIDDLIQEFASFGDEE